MATFATQDDLNALAQLVRTLLDDITTLDASVGEIDTLIEKINHVEALKDITLTYVTEGDVLLFSSDGTWHNVQPAVLNMGIGDGEGSPVDSAIVKSLIQSEGAKLFISKLYDDTAAGQIVFDNGLVTNNTAYFNKGLEVGSFTTGLFGSGAKIDENGRAEMTSLSLREFLEVPELRFNRIDVVSGELWNSIAFGTIESVDIENQVATLKLEDGEYSGLHVNDICRGIFHNIDGYNNTETGQDDCGFDRMQGFSTAYFTPIEMIGERGEQFRYVLKAGTTQHPCPSMKFAVYGNFVDPTRRNSAYSTRSYQRYLKDVSTWEINQTLNVASQFGLLDGLTIEGAPNNGRLTGNGAYLSNVYMTDALIQFTPDQAAALKGKDGYSVVLDHDFASVLVDNEYNIVDLEGQTRELTFYIQAFKGSTELTYDNVYGEGKYFVEYTPTGCEVTFANGVFRITNITGISECYVKIVVNCEGETQIQKTFSVVPLLEPNSQWTTYHDNDALPPIPTGDGTLDGWHRNYTSTAIWMSSKNTRNVYEGEWGDPVRFVGASVAGEDGQYTAFAYTISSVTPPIPTKMSGLPPKDPSGLYTWHMFPPERPNLNVFTFMSQCTVYGDKTQSGWSTPIRMTGDDGIDGTDGTDLEFIYGLFTPTDELERPFVPVSENVDDFVPDMNTAGLDGVDWDDNPHGVSEEKQYEWVCQRTKAAGKQGTTVWGEWTVPVIWSKWGEKGMDGDGYEYIYARTADIDIIPDTPETAQQDEYLPYIKINGVSTGYKWTDDPKGIVSEEYKAEWVCMRKKTDMVWSNFSKPALWSNWGEQGMQGAHYIYRWCLSKSTPAYSANSDNPGSIWKNDSELKAEDDYFVWQIQRLCNPDGTLAGSWGNLIRITGANGKDGEDGNSIEFLYARNNTGIPPSPPPTTQTDDWHGTSTDTNNGNVKIEWFDNPQGVTANIMYEYVCQRYKDRTTQQWGAYSTPGIWARYAEKGKDGDGFEYIYRRFGSYQALAAVSPGGAYYPDVKSGDYQNDDYVPANYTDNPVGPDSSLPYEYVWTRKKKQGTWGNWSDGAMWSRWQSSTFKSTAFIRTNSTPGTPTGGSWSSPNPTTSGWTDGIPSGTAILWSSTRIFTEDGRAPQQATWSTPRQMTDTANFDVEFSSVASPSKPSGHPNTNSQWSNTASSSTIWMATSTMANGVWSDWQVSKIKGETGDKGDKGDKGDTGNDGADGEDGWDGTDGRSYHVSGCPASIRSSLGFLQTTEVTLKATYTSGSSSTVNNSSGYWAAYGRTSSGSWSEIYRIGTSGDSTSSSSSVRVLWSSSTSYTAFWFGYTTSYSYSSSTYLSPTAGSNSRALWSQTVPVVYDGNDGSDADSGYTILRDRGYWSSSNTYYNGSATSVLSSTEYVKYENYDKMKVIDYVQYEGYVYISATNNNTGHTPSTSGNTTYWTRSSKIEVLSVNYLLANHASLGDFNVSNNVFTSKSGGLVLNSTNGSITAKQGSIAGFTLAGSTLTSSSSGHTMTLSSSLGTTSATAGLRFTDNNSTVRLSLSSSSSPWIYSYAGGQIYISSTANQTTQLSGASIYMSSSIGGNIWVDLNQSNWNCAYISISKLPSTSVSTTASGTVRWVSASLGGTTRKVLILA